MDRRQALIAFTMAAFLFCSWTLAINAMFKKRFADDEAQIANLSNAVMHLLHDMCGKK